VSSDRVRLFVALELPERTRVALATWGTVIAPVLGGRAIAAESLHLTLCFLGPVDAVRVASVADAVSRVAGLPAARLETGGALCLPPRRPRVVAVSLLDRDGALATVQSVLSSALESLGVYVPEPRAFLAHVTVLRMRGGRRVRTTELADPPAVDTVGSTVTLFRSRLGSGPARYEALARVGLVTIHE
jgi:RNA 2',3'-cyclic 3'-phosphodiesterase